MKTKALVLNSLSYQCWLSMCVNTHAPPQVGLVFSVTASHAVGRGFMPRPGHTKDHHKNGTNCLPA